MFKPRPYQEKVLQYTGGWMGVSAVPGSGKTQTLSALAAGLIEAGRVEDDQEVLIVTLVNSAVDNFARRIDGEMKKKGLPPEFGYRVRTLHGLAYDIVRERPDLVGLSDRFIIADERDSDEILRGAALTWLRTRPDVLELLTDPELDPYRSSKARSEWPPLVVGLAKSFIRLAKDLQATPELLIARLEPLKTYYPLLEMGIDIYSSYQRALNYRSALDFDDLIALALQGLQTDPEYLARLRRRWPYILEDEAQDSSRLQEQILTLLSGPDGNWVRVGDPNQAIYETFTTASPEYLKNFLDNPLVIPNKLPESGRSTPSIMQLANELIRWTNEEHDNVALRDALTQPYIQPTPPGDPQPNPPDNPQAVAFSSKGFTPENEIQFVVKSVKRWLPEHPDATVAVLDPRNKRGSEVAEELKKNGIDPVELLSSSSSTRQTVRLVGSILHCLEDPTSTAKLAIAFHALHRKEEDQPDLAIPVKKAADLIRNCQRVEDYLWPTTEHDWLASLEREEVTSQVLASLEGFRQRIRKWQAATLLPVDQLILTISQDIFTAPPDLALGHKIALLLEQATQAHPEWHLPEFNVELDSITRNERKFLGFGEEDQGFDPEKHKGKVVVATMHKAKGLEWDRVYMLSVNSYDFPSAEPDDQFISEKWFVPGKLNLEAEALSQLKALIDNDLVGLNLEPGVATRQARLDYARERLRLLFVGITRAKKELHLSWNSGRRNDLHEAVAFRHLCDYWEEKLHELER